MRKILKILKARDRPFKVSGFQNNIKYFGEKHGPFRILKILTILKNS